MSVWPRHRDTQSLLLTLTHVEQTLHFLVGDCHQTTQLCPLTTPAMASVEGIPACLFAAPAVIHPPHLEGDPALATEILPGPPPLVSVQQPVQAKKDHKRVTVALSYLPTSDPGTTYGVNTVSSMAAAAEVDGPRRKRARLEKGCVVSLLLSYASAEPVILYLPITILRSLSRTIAGVPPRSSPPHSSPRRAIIPRLPWR